MNKKLEKVFNEQINKELYSAYLYLSMSAYCKKINLSGFSHWLKIQYQEELFHAIKIVEFLSDKNAEIELTAIDKPESDWDNMISLFENVYQHEKYITESLNNLMDIAVELKDYSAQSFLFWYVNEQIEEEMNADELVQKLKCIQCDCSALLNLDKICSERKFNI